MVRVWVGASVLLPHLNYGYLWDVLQLSLPISYTPLPIAGRLLLCMPNLTVWWVDSSGQIRWFMIKRSIFTVAQERVRGGFPKGSSYLQRLHSFAPKSLGSML